MSTEPLYVLHVLSAMLLVAINFWAFAATNPETRKRVLMWSGISSLGVFLGGFGIHGMQHLGFPGWIVVKIVAWLALSAVAGIAFRRPAKIPALMKLTVGVAALALVMVYLKPF